MRLNYEFSKLCGRSYTGGDIVFTPDGNSILSAVSNRIIHYDLTM
jgi:periodic tryptophan protein 2